MPAFLVKHWFLTLLFGGMCLALLFPAQFQVFTGPWDPSRTVAISLFLMAWTMPTRSLVAEFRQPYAALWAVFLSYGLVPLGAWLIGLLAPSDDVRIGLILVSAVPCTLASAILWTRMAGGNEATALLTVLGTTFTSWLLTTAWLYVLTGASLPAGTQVDYADMMLNLVLNLVVPVLLGQAVRFIPLGRSFAERHKVAISAVAQVLVLAIVLKAAASVGAKLGQNESSNVMEIVLSSIVMAVGLHLFALYCGLFTCRWLGFDRGRQIAVAFSASQKTLQVSLILYDQYFSAYPFAVMPVLFFHVGQLLLDTLIARHLHQGQPSTEEDELPRIE